MKRFSFIIILLLAAVLAVSCSGETDTPETSAENTTAPEDLSVTPATVRVENPNWGFPAHSIEIADETMLTAELDKNSGDVIITSQKRGETEVNVLDCFGHKAIIKVQIAADGSITHEANPCAEEFINAAKYGIIPSRTSTGLADQSSKMQMLIDKVSAQGGGEIFLYPGFYNIKLLTIRDGVTLRMYSGFTDAREGFTDELAEMVKKGEVTVLLVTRIINAEYNKYANDGSKNFTLSGGVIDNNHSSQSILLFGLSENIVVENMIFKDMKNNHVIQITGCNNVTVRNCIFAGFEWSGTFTAETIQIEQSHPGAHSGNIETTPIRFYAGDIHGCRDIVIDSCYFGPSDELPCAHIAIGHHGTAHEAVCDGFKITNNVFDRPTYAAIRFASLANVDITGNTFIATKDSNKLCNEANPAFILLYSNTGEVTYDNVVDGRKVTKAQSFEQPGTRNVNISGNSFTVEKGSDKRVILVTGTSTLPGANYQASILRQDSYDGKPFAVTGYFKSTNYFRNINFTDNTVTYSGQPSVKDYIFRFQSVYGMKFENNTVTLNSCSFGKSDEGVSGLSCVSVKSGVAAETYTVQSKVSNKAVVLANPDGSSVKLIFTVATTHNIIAGEGGRIELSDDGRGNAIFTVIPNEGYVFDGWTTEKGAFTGTGNVKITEKTVFTANFSKK